MVTLSMRCLLECYKSSKMTELAFKSFTKLLIKSVERQEWTARKWVLQVIVHKEPVEHQLVHDLNSIR